MFAVLANPQSDRGDMIKWLENKKWITASNTLYERKQNPSVFDAIVKLGLAKEENGKLSLTEKGEKWVVPAKILENESEIGGDLHRQILIKTIEYLHESNMFVMATPQPESFDLIAYLIDAKKKFMWDDKNRRAYEIQTSARKDSVLANADKKQKYNIPITWVTYDESMLEEIKKITENKDEYLLIKV